MNNKLLIVTLSVVSLVAIAHAEPNCDLIIQSSQKLKGTLHNEIRGKLLNFITAFKEMMQRAMQMQIELQQAERSGINYALRNQMDQELVKLASRAHSANAQLEIAQTMHISTDNPAQINEFMMNLTGLSQVMLTMHSKRKIIVS